MSFYLCKINFHRKEQKVWMDAIFNTINNIATKSVHCSSRNSGHSRHSFDASQQVRLSRRTECAADEIHPDMTMLKPRQLEQWDMYEQRTERQLTSAQ